MKSGGVQVTVADVDADGLLEIVAADTHGTLAVFTAAGTELWERHVKSGIAQAGSSGLRLLSISCCVAHRQPFGPR